MEKILLSEIANVLGTSITQDFEITDICTDTRALSKGCVFVAIKGEKFDAHDFIGKAFEMGAVACVTERQVDEFNCLVTDDCRKAFLKLANYYRMKFNPLLVGITGSVGKTTTKEMISLVLSQKYENLKTQGNFNNEIGLPKTLFNLTSKHKTAVIEMGMSNFGEISKLSKTACPDVAVITNIGFSHIENLKSQEGILKAKLEILDGMNESGKLVLNADDKHLFGAIDKISQEVHTFGIYNEKAEVRAINICEKDDITFFNAIYDGKSIPITLTTVGEHNVLNALAGICIGRIAGIDDITISEAFKKFVPDSLRQNISEKNGQTVITDCYNASPDSMKASLNVLSNMNSTSRKIAVLGDMLELGQMSEKLHRIVGEFVAKVKPDMLFCYGKEAEFIADEAQKSGVNVFTSQNKTELSDNIKSYVKSGDTVLFKASRGMRLEEIIKNVYNEE